jgi:NNP family nitrate/nitrite transporter-like MFS transporter
MNSIASVYFQDYHGMNPRMAGMMASLYGMMNLFARSAGGAISDWANRHFGMRGRIWAMWIVQTIEGLLCIALGAITVGMKSPYKAKMIQGMTKIAKDVWVPMNGTMIPECGSDALIPTKAWLAQHNQEDGLYMVLHPPSPFGDGDACIQNQNKLSMCVFVMILFSLCVQAAEGLHYGVVPYVSRPALGIVSGMVGAGGNLGAVVSLRAFFFGTMRVDSGLMGMGIMVCLVNLTMFGIYFPDKGGMLFPAGGLGSYDPQLWKPPAEYRGADSVDLSAMKTEEKKTGTESAA